MLLRNGTPDFLLGDPLRLGQILINLVSNAVKFTEMGGTVTVSVSSMTLNGGAVELHFTITDTGIGMSAEQLSRLFRPFVQADSSMSRRYGGTGLGLTISRQLVELMGGHLQIDSEEHSGTECRFSICFTLSDERALPQPFTAADFSSHRAMVVDDLETARTSLREMLAMFGVTVTDVASGPAALAELERSRVAGELPYDVVLLDWKMPGMDGLETARAIKSAPHIAKPPIVIMVTAYSRDEIIRKSETIGVEGVLVKPVTPSILLDTLYPVLRSSIQGSLNTAGKRQAQTNYRFAEARVLLVEDNAINQQVAREILESAGITVTVAADGGKAVAILADPDHGQDVVLMDLHMPVVDGFSATRLIRRQAHNISLPIVAMTANAMSGDRERCFAIGMDGHIAKPIDVDQLFSTLQRWINLADVPANSEPFGLLAATHGYSPRVEVVGRS